MSEINKSIAKYIHSQFRSWGKSSPEAPKSDYVPSIKPDKPAKPNKAFSAERAIGEALGRYTFVSKTDSEKLQGLIKRYGYDYSDWRTRWETNTE